MSKLKTVWDAIIYYGGSNFVNGKREQHHTHVISIHNTEKIGTAYASDIGMNAIICGIKTYNQCIDDMSTNYGRSSLKHLAIWQAGLKESKEALDSIVNKSLVYTQEMADNGELPSVGMICKHLGVEKKVTAPLDVNNKMVLTSVANGIYSLAHCNDIYPIYTRTKKERAIDEIESELSKIAYSTRSALELAYDEWVGE
tara:strand:+ start:4914 stop:5510 length:597 start_codon:yes stop_codon:yes gene_type:complete